MVKQKNTLQLMITKLFSLEIATLTSLLCICFKEEQINYD